jgi:malate dehydrogenase
VPCAVRLTGQYGVNDLFIGVPAVIGAGGVEKVFEVRLNGDEKAAFAKSIESVQKVVDEAKLR